MANDPILHLLGLAKKAGRLEIGEEPVGSACRARQARLLLLAADAAPNTYRRAAHFGQAGNVLWLQLPFTKEELGFILGRSSCAMLALTDAGFAAAVSEKLRARDPEKYEAASQQLRQKRTKCCAVRRSSASTRRTCGRGREGSIPGPRLPKRSRRGRNPPPGPRGPEGARRPRQRQGSAAPGPRTPSRNPRPPVPAGGG